ncbi:hypothetical protein [Nocardioides halotolerans]|uniref:hypothetical protein n=1 Tax=Nocardioides halotolerans TaxID=433660 RepID=UPI0012F76CC3|nr:hypothetical protein [Nocardioides halotolerans]
MTTDTAQPFSRIPDPDALREPVCPTCGGTQLINIQEIEERREYSLRTVAPDLAYGIPEIAWTIHMVNDLSCEICEWTVPMSSIEADNVLE